MSCPKNGMLITAFVCAKNATKATAEGVNSTASGKKPPIINSDDCRSLLT